MIRGKVFATLIVSAVGSGILAPQGYAAEDCDPKIIPAAPIPFASKGHGESKRCEGYYRTPISGKLFSLVSFTNGLGRIPPVNIQELTLEPDPQVKDVVAIVAKSISSTEFYQMTASVAPGQKLVWPLSEVVLKPDGPKARIGVLASYVDNGIQVFVALRDSGRPQSSTYLRLRMAGTVINLKWRWRPDDASGVFAGWQVINTRALPGQIVDLNIDSLPKGRTYLEITGTPSNSTMAKPPLRLHLVR